MSELALALIGLGDIASKAYLPVLAATPGLDIRLCTRDRATLDRLGDAYRIGGRYTSVDDVVQSGIRAAFVHAATEAHVQIVEKLLSAGVHVYVDKPLADNFRDAERLVRRAQAAGLSLMVGFNRRYAPGYAGLQDLPRPLILMQKNRERHPDSARRVIFDDFIHVVDTLRFLAPGQVVGQRIHARIAGGLVEHLVLELSGDGFVAVGMMNRNSGLSEESCEVSGGGLKRRVVNLAEVVDYSGSEKVARRGDWTSVARQRGVEGACRAFINEIREGRLLDAEDALITHKVCEDIFREVARHG
ncbi:Gfo/Idh/MocA family protein [Sinosporangium album]|uniref:Gfo/Idh/MocA family protein n=1 Tax=Sinosporangium album TaxID=504805 RepID=UPI001FE10FBA|nr:Gfo/Idh/MocA family oxidoreductase [Sinosporangium album]